MYKFDPQWENVEKEAEKSIDPILLGKYLLLGEELPWLIVCSSENVIHLAMLQFYRWFSLLRVMVNVPENNT